MALSFVTTPIGNEKDITIQAQNELKKSEILYCEDTRKTKELLKRLDIDYSDKKIFSFHDHSGDELLIKICEGSKDFKTVYVSDAGSPLISDPAYPLIKYAIANEIEYKIISGITSPIYALELSGFPAIPFTFHGFVGRSKSDLEHLITKINQSQGTHIFFEGVSRVEKTLDFLSQKLPELEFAIARELTKTHESIHRFKGNEFSKLKSEMTIKGEFVLLIHNPRSQAASSDLSELAKDVLESKGKGKTLAKLLAKCLDGNVKDIYNQLNS